MGRGRRGISAAELLCGGRFRRCTGRSVAAAGRLLSMLRLHCRRCSSAYVWCCCCRRRCCVVGRQRARRQHQVRSEAADLQVRESALSDMQTRHPKTWRYGRVLAVYMEWITNTIWCRGLAFHNTVTVAVTLASGAGLWAGTLAHLAQRLAQP